MIRCNKLTSHRWHLKACVTLLLASTPFAVGAQEGVDATKAEITTGAENEDQREGKSDGLTISPYLWGPNIGGTASIGPLEAPLDLSLSELAGGLQIAGMGHVEYDTGPVFVYVEGIGAGFADPEFASFGNQDVDATALLLETGVGKAFHWDLADGKRLTVSPYAGVRYVYLQAEINGPLLVLSSENDWVDPVVGAIADLQLSDRVSVLGKVDFAGLSVTSNTYANGMIGVQYRTSDALALVVAYRATQANFAATSGISADLDAHGPLIGLRYRP